MSLCEPDFVHIDGRALFTLRFSPTGAVRRRVLVLPPFAEEANRSRRLTALTARALAAVGCEVLMFDLSGTGDSAGDFGEAAWEGWLAEVRAIANWFEWRVSEERPAVLAVRSGLLLAPALDLTGAEILGWQPVLDGGRYLQQFLRTRVMAEKFAGRSESVKELLERFRAGAAVEVAGYTLSAQLATAFAAVRIEAPALAVATAVGLLEFKPQGGSEPSAPVGALARALHERGCAASAEVLAAEQFWTTQEIAAPQVAVDNALTWFAPTVPSP